MGPRVGVVIPLYNGRSVIGRTLASLLRQTLADWSCVVVDDGSTDGGGDEATRVATADGTGRVRVVRRENGGVCRARNTGLDALLGHGGGGAAPDYVMMLDAGDTLAPGALSALVATAQAAGTRGALGDFRFVDPDGRAVGRHTGRFERVGLGELLGSVYMLTHAHLVESSLWSAAGGVRFDPRVEVCEDTDCWLRLAEAARADSGPGPVWARCPEVVADYWVGRPSRSSDQARMQEWTERVYTGAYARCARWPEACATPERLEGVLARAAFGHATRAALAGGDTGMAGAEAIFAGSAGALELDGPFIARTVLRAVAVCLALDASRPEHRPRWLPGAVRWTQRLGTLGWAERGAVEAAVECLLSATPDAAAPTERSPHEVRS